MDMDIGGGGMGWGREGGRVIGVGCGGWKGGRGMGNFKGFFCELDFG